MSTPLGFVLHCIEVFGYAEDLSRRMAAHKVDGGPLYVFSEFLAQPSNALSAEWKPGERFQGPVYREEFPGILTRLLEKPRTFFQEMPDTGRKALWKFFEPLSSHIHEKESDDWKQTLGEHVDELVELIRRFGKTCLRLDAPCLGLLACVYYLGSALHWLCEKDHTFYKNAIPAFLDARRAWHSFSTSPRSQADGQRRRCGLEESLLQKMKATVNHDLVVPHSLIEQEQYLCRQAGTQWAEEIMAAMEQGVGAVALSLLSASYRDVADVVNRRIDVLVECATSHQEDSETRYYATLILQEVSTLHPRMLYAHVDQLLGSLIRPTREVTTSMTLLIPILLNVASRNAMIFRNRTGKLDSVYVNVFVVQDSDSELKDQFLQLLGLVGRASAHSAEHVMDILMGILSGEDHSFSLSLILEQIRNVCAVYKASLAPHMYFFRVYSSKCLYAKEAAQEIVRYYDSKHILRLEDALLQNQEDIYGRRIVASLIASNVPDVGSASCLPRLCKSDSAEHQAAPNGSPSESVSTAPAAEEVRVQRLSRLADRPEQKSKRRDRYHVNANTFIGGTIKKLNPVEVAWKKQEKRKRSKRRVLTVSKATVINDIEDSLKSKRKKIRRFLKTATKRIPLPTAVSRSGLHRRLTLYFQCNSGAGPEFIVDTIHWSKWMRYIACGIKHGYQILYSGEVLTLQNLYQLYQQLYREDIDPEATFEGFLSDPCLTSTEQEELAVSLQKDGVYEEFEPSADGEKVTWHRKVVPTLVASFEPQANVNEIHIDESEDTDRQSEQRGDSNIRASEGASEKTEAYSSENAVALQVDTASHELETKDGDESPSGNETKPRHPCHDNDESCVGQSQRNDVGHHEHTKTVAVSNEPTTDDQSVDPACTDVIAEQTVASTATESTTSDKNPIHENVFTREDHVNKPPDVSHTSAAESVVPEASVTTAMSTEERREPLTGIFVKLGPNKKLRARRKTHRYFVLTASTLVYYTQDYKTRKGDLSLSSIVSWEEQEENWVTLNTPGIHHGGYQLQFLDEDTKHQFLQRLERYCQRAQHDSTM